MEGCPEGGNAVLTRRMAKRQHCPLMPTAKIYEHHVNGVQINCEVIEYPSRTSPRWYTPCNCIANRGCRRAFT